MKILSRTILLLFTAYFILISCQLASISLKVPGIYACSKIADDNEDTRPSLFLHFKSDRTVEILDSLSNLDEKNPESIYIIEWNKVIINGAFRTTFLVNENELISDELKLRCKKQ
jgi:hypothetical protein